jgi:hypothetical protein
MVPLHAVEGQDGSLAGGGVDADAAVFFEMSPASAEQITLQIRSMMEQAWEYVDARLGDLRLTVPREERGAVVQSLSRAQLSLRAIAKVLGVDVATVHRTLGASNPNDPADGDDVEELEPIRGRDGKSYPRRRRPASRTCSICGEVHDAEAVECPWDLFAQGRGPRPVCQEDRLGEPGRHQERADVVEVEERREPAEGVDMDAQLEPANADELHAATILDSVTPAVCLVDELATLPQAGRPDRRRRCVSERGRARGRHPRADRAPAVPGRGHQQRRPPAAHR